MENVVWDKIRSGSRVYLPQDSSLKSFNDEIRMIGKGWYFITGFWVDMCGLNHADPNGLNEVYIQSRELVNFFVK